MLKLTNLEKIYRTEEIETVALNKLSIEVKQGEFVAIMGPSGCGKSTLLNIIGLLDDADSGSFLFNGEEVIKYNERKRADLRKRNIGFVFQSFNLIDELTVYENIDFFCGLYIKDKDARKKLVEEAIDFAGLREYMKYRPKKLSGGLLRRLNIACGIAHKPKLIIFDEPTVAVDPQSRNAILEGIRSLNHNGATIIYTSHYMEEVEELCSRIVIMDRGRNVTEGTATKLKASLKNRETIIVDIKNASDEIVNGIKEINHIYDVRESGEKLIIKCDGGTHNLVHVMNYLMEKNVDFGRVNSELPTLNDVFLEITGKELRD